MFIQIENIGLHLYHIIDIEFSKESVYITTTERDPDGNGNRVLEYSGSEANAIKVWWEDHADVHRII